MKGCTTAQQHSRCKVTKKKSYNVRNLLKILLFQLLHEHYHAVQHENLAFPGLPNFVAPQQLEFADTFIVVVLDADASFPFLDLPLGSPEPDIYRLRTVENQAGR